jgi:tetratricopeptide (TPR) repeat protein
VILHSEHNAPDYERWLAANEARLPNGTLLVTGLGSFVHYGAHLDGFRLAWFAQPLSPAWKLEREYPVLTYLPRPEPARLWRLERPKAAPPVVHDVPEDLTPLAGIDDPTVLFTGGMARYDARDYPAARMHFRKLLLGTSAEAEDAAFFYAASFFREGDWRRARHEFKRLLWRWPRSRWVPAAYWHVATCEKQLGHSVRARRLLATIVRRFPDDPTTVRMARHELASVQRRRRGVLTEWWRRVRRSFAS